jgi:polyisoprenyl-phosphate glycosyltransferase
VKLSVIVPVYNERANIHPFYDRARAVLDTLEGLDVWEIVFVNDGSTDDSLKLILNLRDLDPRVKVITLARNFGYHAVLIAGLTLADSDLYTIIDVDCEDPPELLSSFYDSIRLGSQVAYGIRSQRDEPRMILWLRGMFYWINRSIADSPVVLWMAEFVMMTRQVRDAILAPKTTYPFLRAEIAHVGYKRVGVPYFRARRSHGESHYSLYSMTRFAIGGFLASSTFPLRLVLYVAFVMGALFPVAVWLCGGFTQQTLVVTSVLQFYFLLLSLPVLALYLARNYRNSMARPVFLIDTTQTHLS